MKLEPLPEGIFKTFANQIDSLTTSELIALQPGHIQVLSESSGPTELPESVKANFSQQ
jgi:hypothetical protein